MRFVFGQLLLGSLLSPCFVNAQQQSPQKREIVAEISIMPPPEQLSAFRDLSDAVIVASSVSGQGAHYKPSQSGPDTPVTVHQLVVKQTLKWHQEVPADGGVIPVIERAGVAESATTRTVTSERVHIVPNADYVLFLHWNAYFGQFELQNGAHGVYRIKNGTIEAEARSKLGESQQARGLDDFVKDLKSKPAKK
jgi:hypothetical protein